MVAYLMNPGGIISITESVILGKFIASSLGSVIILAARPNHCPGMLDRKGAGGKLLPLVS
jgi:hypothetical protein